MAKKGNKIGPFQEVPFRLVREINGLIDSGISVRYIAELCNVSWWTINEINNRSPKSEYTIQQIENFVKNKSFHLSKNQILNSFKGVNKNSTFINLDECGFSEWELSRIKQ